MPRTAEGGNAVGEGRKGALRVGSDGSVNLEFHGSLVSDDAAGEAHQDRGEGHGAFPVRGLPDGGGRRAEAIVRGDPGAGKTPAAAKDGAAKTSGSFRN